MVVAAGMLGITKRLECLRVSVANPLFCNLTPARRTRFNATCWNWLLGQSSSSVNGVTPVWHRKTINDGGRVCHNHNINKSSKIIGAKKKGVGMWGEGQTDHLLPRVRPVQRVEVGGRGPASVYAFPRSPPTRVVASPESAWLLPVPRRIHCCPSP